MMDKKTLPYRLILVSLTLGLILACLLSATLGRYPIRVRELVGILLSKIPFVHIEPTWTPTAEALLLEHRIPRILLAALVGCSLSTAGACYQGLFANPMAAPDILGASAGAAFGAALSIILGLGRLMGGIMAFAFSLITVSLVLLFASRTRGNQTVGFILAGVMLSSLVSSCTSFLKLIADTEEQLPAITYWLMGSFNGASPQDVRFVLIPMCLGLIPIVLLRWNISILSLGDAEAYTLGINAGRLRILLIICASLITAASVSVSGLIGWVGLVIPHVARRLVGNEYRRLIPTTMLTGALFLLLVDDLCRTLFTSDFPIGILTAFVGAPFLLYLIFKEDGRCA